MTRAFGVTALLLLVAGSCTRSSDQPAVSPVERLGKQIFEDTNLSDPPGQSCASCHDPTRAFTGNAGSRVAAVAAGSRVQVLGSRNVPTAMYAMFSPEFGFDAEVGDSGAIAYVPSGGLFWDGRASTLADQAAGPLLNPAEMNNPSERAVVNKVRNSDYAGLFEQVFGEDVFADEKRAYQAVLSALAAFEQSATFRPFTSKFDGYLRGDEELSPAERRGFQLFMDPDKGNCIACHAGDPSSRDPADWLFTDFTYDNLGVPRNRAIPANQDPTHFDLGMCQQEGLAELAPAGVDIESLCGAFKVPTLRNVARTGPYMHNGNFESLRDVVSFYATRDTEPARWYPVDSAGQVSMFDDLPRQYHGNVNTSEVPYGLEPGQLRRLTEQDIDDLVAFLETLTDRLR